MCQTFAVIDHELWQMEALSIYEYEENSVGWDFWNEDEAPGPSFIMSLIEGVGDEVTVIFCAFLLGLILAIAWISTNVHDQFLIRIIILDRARLQQLVNRITGRHAAEIQNGSIQIQTPLADIQQDAQTAESPADPDRVQTEGAKSDSGSEESTSDGISIPGPESNLSGSSSEEKKHSPELRHRTTRQLDSLSTLDSVDNSDNSEPIRQSVISSTQPSDQSEITSQRISSEEATGQASDDVSRPENEECPDSEVDPDDRKAGHIRIKLKYLDDRQRLVQAKPEETIGDFKRKHFEAELAENMKVRFVFRGQELRQDSNSLSSYHVEDNSVIHCLLNRVERQEDAANQARGVEFDVGTLMFPLFGLILLLIWYCRFTYKQYFNAMSTLSLIGITFLFLVAVLATFRLGDHPENEVTVQTATAGPPRHEHQD